MRPPSPRFTPRSSRATIYKDSAPARLRDCTGLTKKAFAERCGIPLNTLKTIEARTSRSRGGSGTLSDYHAQLLSIATGASAPALSRNQLRVAGGHRAYTAADFQTYERALSTSSGWRDQCFASLKARIIDFLVECADKEGLGALHQFVAFAVAMDDLEKRFDALKSSSGQAKPTNVEWLLREVFAGQTLGEAVAGAHARDVANNVKRATRARPSPRGSRTISRQ